MPLRVLHLSTYDTHGGAARAAYALHSAMREQGIDSRMHVARKDTKDPYVTEVRSTSWRRSQFLDRQLWRLQRAPSKSWRSPARFGALSAHWINDQDVDLVHLHWVTDGFLSIEEIGRIRKPVVWSFCDMWPIMGTEHYGPQDEHARWRTGFTTENKVASGPGIDIDRWTFDRKRLHWQALRRSLHAVPASEWMRENLRASVIGHEWSQTLIPHVVNTDSFAPLPKGEARRRLRCGIPEDSPTVLFLSSGGLTDRRKGWDLLHDALEIAALQIQQLNVLIIGPIPSDSERTALEARKIARLHWIGSIASDHQLRLLYGASDVVAIPSREDNLPLVALEAQSCGRPVLTFATGGLPDVIDPRFSGYLAEPNNPQDLANGLAQVLGQTDADRIRQHALEIWSPQAVVPQFSALYEQLG